MPSLYREVVLNTLLSLITAFLLLAIFPRFDVHWLAPVALTPLLFVLGRTDAGWQRFAYGWAAGVFYWFFLCTWIQFVLEAHGGMGVFGSWASFFLFAILKGLHLAVFAWLAGPLMRKSYALPAVAALWTGLERTHATFGFTWLDLGNAGINMSVPLRVAPFIGVYGVSFILAMLGTALACVALRQPRARLYPLAALLVLPFFPRIPEDIPANRSALVVQPNIDPDMQWTALLQDKTERELSQISNVLHSKLVIWPELPAPLYYYDDPDFRRAATEIALKHGSFLFGTVAYTGEHQPMNSAILLGAEGTLAGRYDKIELVPFGEFVPPVFGWVNRITQEAGDFVPGRDINVLLTPNDRLGVFICYESAFPDLVRQFTAKGANVLVNISNDAYFGHSEAREQHLLIARMRAVENRRYLIRATNDGITAVINPAGEITQRLPMYKEVAAPMRYGLVPATTFYARHGDWFAWSCLLAGVGSSAYQLMRNRREIRQSR